jgi:hypothetical protein
MSKGNKAQKNDKANMKKPMDKPKEDSKSGFAALSHVFDKDK